jgi:acetoacetyl-CoA synthetase
MLPMWQPTQESIESSNLKAFFAYIESNLRIDIEDYESLANWALNDKEAFWSTVWDFCGVVATKKGTSLLEGSEEIYEAKFFAEARLNFAENLLQQDGQEPAIIFWGEDKVKCSVSHQELSQAVSDLGRYLKKVGVSAGDRVAGFVPNTPEAVIAMLATASIGAVWTSCSPDFGVDAVLDRCGQVEPKVLFSADGYYYGGKSHDCLEKLQLILLGLPSVQRAVIFPYAGSKSDFNVWANAISWQAALKEGEGKPVIDFEYVPFDHPLYILYSSGTTGAPKCIVHSVGGTLLQHLKEHQLHCDIKPGDRVFYFTTCGWMMWNWQVSSLASGATLLLYDGSPFYPDGNILFDYAEKETMTLFGASAKYIDSLNKQGYAPKKTHDLSALKMMTSTGSPLVPESFDYVYESIAEDVCLASISGGSDIVSCFVLGNPIAPVYRGEIQTAGLGMDVDIFDSKGQPLPPGEKGELVCKQSFPCMPIGFWNDPDNKRYREAYFNKFPRVWCHGDFVAKTEHGGYIIYGRSDAILNPGGVRIGTAEIYRQVEQLPQVLESLVIGQEWDGDVRVVLFVKLRHGEQLTDQLVKTIKTSIRSGASPRHVPAKVIAVEDIPRTKSGKIVEIAVRDIVHGREIQNLGALANPEALAFFKNREELQS